MDQNKKAVAIFDKLAEVYQSKFMDVSLYKKTLDLFCGLASEKASVLELACGPGNITRYVLDRNPQFKIFGTDLAPAMIKLAKANNPAAHFELLDCRNLETIDGKYDAIICGFCLPYLSEEETKKLISDTALVLNENGLLYLSTMEDDHTASGLKKASSGDEIFMHFYTLEFLECILMKNNFKLIHTERIISKTENATVTDLVVIARLR